LRCDVIPFSCTECISHGQLSLRTWHKCKYGCKSRKEFITYCLYLSLCFIDHYATKMYVCEWRYISTYSQTSRPVWIWVNISTSRKLHRSAAVPGTHRIEGWMGPKLGLDRHGEEAITFCHQVRNPDRPAHSKSLYSLIYVKIQLFVCHISINEECNN
jgi:hypothetical protein